LGLVLGAGLAHFGWGMLHFAAVKSQPHFLVTPSLGYTLLLFPRGPLPGARRPAASPRVPAREPGIPADGLRRRQGRLPRGGLLPRSPEHGSVGDGALRGGSRGPPGAGLRDPRPRPAASLRSPAPPSLGPRRGSHGLRRRSGGSGGMACDTAP